MKKVESRGVSTSSISSVMDFQKLSSRYENEDQELSSPIENVHKIIALPSATSSVVERVVLLESLSNDFMGPQTPRRDMDEDAEDAMDVETELVKVAPMPTVVGPGTPIPSTERRPCDPVARFLLSKC
mmetsp:Transcript_32418/g.78740  ORF Transcript_32418/g.78740 Transcript_32418/m.78740 type:complete len:128 (+) Transcript_32418:393-776(+)|eukprot:CAMPEP_0113646738 /NCGR_PEP_ID=MMETSP0017_2-20120614/24705_1 /TAXON_ID=2856 /ORGANISM="Cylindrotheca closterium" /LENGTH=127 /DNA_ID=CAMNT_0000558683 /DNA_START=176 /DNA_END=559 /DNA_ORIENTATION=- /assembly_acc=CAM_ASM_000147